LLFCQFDNGNEYTYYCMTEISFSFWQPLLFRLSELWINVGTFNCTIRISVEKLKKVQPWNSPPFSLREITEVLFWHIVFFFSKSNQELCNNGWSSFIFVVNDTSRTYSQPFNDVEINRKTLSNACKVDAGRRKEAARHQL